MNLDRLISAGPVVDIFRAERGYALVKCIGENADAINKSRQNFGELFATVQTHAQEETLLAVARLYDSTSKRYPTRSIRALLEFLQRHASDLPSMSQKPTLRTELAKVGMPADRVESLTSAPDADATRQLVAFFQERLAMADVVRSVQLLKTTRDKRIAHNEDTEPTRALDAPTWDNVLQLLALAKDIVGIVGWAYLSRAYTHEGGYSLSADSQRPALAMLRLLRKLDIVEPRRGFRPQS